MLKNLKTVLVKSYIATIALGWLFAQAVIHFAYIFSAPVVGWLRRKEYRFMTEGAATPATFSLQDAVPDLVRCVALVLLGYLLLRWLYYKLAEETTDDVPIQPQTDAD